MIDTHSHLYSQEFDSDYSEMFFRAREAGIECVVLPNIDKNSVAEMYRFSDNFPDFCYLAMGLHPTSVNQDYREQLSFIKKQFDIRTFCAVGEIGVDLYWDKTFLTEQLDAFEQQLQWALEYNLPVIIHSRKALPLILPIVEKYAGKNLNGVFHCFEGSLDEAQQIVALGFKLGVNGIVTFKNSTLPEILRHIDLTHLLLETDAPYLSPVPHRGKRNEPAFLLYVASKLAQIHQVNLSEVCSQTTENARKLFGLGALLENRRSSLNKRF